MYHFMPVTETVFITYSFLQCYNTFASKGYDDLTQMLKGRFEDDWPIRQAIMTHISESRRTTKDQEKKAGIYRPTNPPTSKNKSKATESTEKVKSLIACRTPQNNSCRTDWFSTS